MRGIGIIHITYLRLAGNTHDVWRLDMAYGEWFVQVDTFLLYAYACEIAGTRSLIAAQRGPAQVITGV